MQKHTGSIVEMAIRRSGISIAELARRVGVNRRSIYNWFEQPSLSLEIISKVGLVLGYDFSSEFPEIKAYKPSSPVKENEQLTDSHSSEDISYWKNKYITLLEKYNDVLIKSRGVSKENAA
jgi:transcriptional regulator with XRE-family HTH domain